MAAEVESARTNNSDIAYDTVRQRLRQGSIGPNDRLIDKALAAELNMSRMPAREALIRLVHEGYLVGSTKGFRLPELSRTDILDIFEIRLALEPRAAASASHALTAEAVERLEAALEKSRRATLDGRVADINAANGEFRDLWLDFVPNKRIVSVISRYYDQVNTVRRMTMSDFESQRLSIYLMESLMDGFLRKDSFFVFEQLAKFIAAARDRYIAVVP
jgi:DNA-binding GntR family transcriptional regulator